MRTQRVIAAIVLSSTLACLMVAVFLSASLGWPGAALTAASGLAVYLLYVSALGPWHRRWGSTNEEVARPMPGDSIIENAASTTRAIGIAAPPKQVWPWLVQIGFGRAGWYSYDWIDNDGNPSANRIVPELQNLQVGDTIEMVPGFGPSVVEMKPNQYFVAGDEKDGTWCLALYPMAQGGTRLISRWRQKWVTKGVAARFFVLISDPGAFIMEQKMLREIKRKAEENGSLHQKAVDDDRYQRSNSEIPV
ncbi:MAG TPA: hypothetical protein VE174_13375 [Actinomycetota bacterium]|nr:hypothetical protein [Actinomycetota bacterium]